MNLLRQIAEDLKSDEGWVPHAYDDATGKPATAEGWITLGYGFMVDARRRGRIPRDVADYWLDYEIEQIMARLDSALPWLYRAPDGVQRALANMAFQMGVTGLLSFRKTIGHLADGDYLVAADEALRSLWAEQTPNRAKRVTGWIRNAET